jgi:hypothetical protein
MLRKTWRVLVVLVVLTSILLGIRAYYLNLVGRPQVATTVALSITIFAVNLIRFKPALIPRRPEASSDESDAVADTPMPPPRWWNWPARAVIVVTWLARGALTAFGVYYAAQQLDRAFNLTLFLLPPSLRLLALLRRVGHQLAGFRLDWSEYRGWAGVERLVTAALTAVFAGYIYVISDLLFAYVPVVPRFIYRILDGWWHVPWLNVSLVSAACAVVLAIVVFLFGYARYFIAIAMGREREYLTQIYEQTGVIRKSGDPRQRWRFGDP